VLNNAFEWYKEENGDIAILDGTNCTKASRLHIVQHIKSQRPHLFIKPIFVEVICNNQDSMNYYYFQFRGKLRL
jgi:hypothetical protein